MRLNVSELVVFRLWLYRRVVDQIACNRVHSLSFCAALAQGLAGGLAAVNTVVAAIPKQA
jgi:hypothetical protein